MARPIVHTLDQLQVLEAIAETGSFAAAARQLHRVPSAVSHTVARLEDALGVEIFDRSGHRAELTAAGARVLEGATAVLAAGRVLDALAEGLQDGWEPTLHVVVDGALPMGPILRTLRHFLAEQRPTRVRLDVEFRQGVLHCFETGGADLMVALGLEEAEGCVTVPLPAVPMRLVVGAPHALAGVRDLARADLSSHAELLVRDSSPTVREGAEAWFGGRSQKVHLSDFSTKRLALLEGLGFGWMPLHLIEDDLRDGRMVCLDLSGESTEWTWQPLLVRRAERPQGRASRLWEALLRRELGLEDAGGDGPVQVP